MNIKIKNPKYKFCVLMPIFQRDDIYKIIDKAILSIFKNSIIPNQFIIIVDGPLKNKFIKKIYFYKKKYKIQIIWLKEKSKGITLPLNEGLSKVETPFVARADGDDINELNRFERQISYAKKGYELIGSNIMEIDLKGKILSKKKMPEKFIDIKRYSKIRNPFNHMTVFFKKDLAIKYGGYPDLYLKEDYGLWLKFIKNNRKIININATLVRATTGEDFYINRRSGLGYVKSEYGISKYLFNLKINNLFETIIILMLRVSFILLFSKIKKIFYLKFLRAKINNY
jgi:hypothetical protein